MEATFYREGSSEYRNISGAGALGAIDEGPVEGHEVDAGRRAAQVRSIGEIESVPDQVESVGDRGFVFDLHVWQAD